MNSLEVKIIEKECEKYLYKRDNILYCHQPLKEALCDFNKRQRDKTNIKFEITVRIDYGDIPAMFFSKDIIDFFEEGQYYVKLIFFYGGDERKDINMKSELNITGNFYPEELSKIFEQKSDSEYLYKRFKNENGFTKRHSAWCIHSGEYSTNHFPIEIKKFLSNISKHKLEVEKVKKDKKGYLILENVIDIPPKKSVEIIFTPEVWKLMKELCIDDIDFDVYVDE